jgi:diguanylate cyclase (GGDEF)-like protein
VLLDALRRLWAVVLGDDVPAPGPSPEGSPALREGGRGASPRGYTRRDDVIAPDVRSELRERARSSGAVIAAASALVLPGWALVDRLLEPTLAGGFLVYRLLGDLPILAVVWLLCATPLGRRRPELLTCLALAVVQVGVAWMLPQVDHVDFYLMGFSLGIYASGCLLVSHPRWTVALVATSVASLVLFTLLDPTPAPAETLTGTAAYLATASLIAVLAHVNRYRLSVRELMTRTRLEREQERSRVLLTRLERLSNEDPLTGLANRRRWDTELTAACVRAGGRGDGLAVLLIDLDHFKQLNDRHGHPGGDEALRCVAGMLSARVRGGDLVARLGGDELGVLMPGADETRAVELAEQLRAGAARLRPAGFEAGEVTLSVGVAVAAGPITSPQAIMAEADQQLYRAKTTRNSVGAALPARGAPLG